MGIGKILLFPSIFLHSYAEVIVTYHVKVYVPGYCAEGIDIYHRVSMLMFSPGLTEQSV